MCNMFRSILCLTPEDVLPAVYLAVGKIAPAHEGVELNVGDSAISDAVAEVTGVSRSRMHEAYAKVVM